MRRFFAPLNQISGGSLVLGPEETRHLRDVLRLKTADRVNVFDGEGREYLAEIAHISKNSTALNLIGEIPPKSPESPLDLTLAASILKGEKFDLIVQKAVELGVMQIAPLLTARGDVKLRDTQKRVDRWRRIVLEAAKQSGRAALMKIGEPVEFVEFVQKAEQQADCSLLMFSERGGEGFPERSDAKKITALVGPEGGWEDSEIEAARQAGFSIVTLGGRILRAETAAISIAAIFQHRFGDLR